MNAPIRLKLHFTVSIPQKTRFGKIPNRVWSYWADSNRRPRVVCMGTFYFLNLNLGSAIKFIRSLSFWGSVIKFLKALYIAVLDCSFSLSSKACASLVSLIRFYFYDLLQVFPFLEYVHYLMNQCLFCANSLIYRFLACC